MELPGEKIEQYDNRLSRKGSTVAFENFVDGHEAIDFVHHCLLKTYTETDVMKWWNKKNPLFENRAPIDVWPTEPQRIIEIAIFIASTH
jgi:hypothetical protein